MMTVQQLIDEIKKPGDIYADINSANDVWRWKQNKKEIIFSLEMMNPEMPAPWTILIDADNDRVLDPQDY